VAVVLSGTRRKDGWLPIWVTVHNHMRTGVTIDRVTVLRPKGSFLLHYWGHQRYNAYGESFFLPPKDLSAVGPADVGTLKVAASGSTKSNSRPADVGREPFMLKLPSGFDPLAASTRRPSLLSILHRKSAISFRIDLLDDQANCRTFTAKLALSQTQMKVFSQSMESSEPDDLGEA
jgi:hypothetical protein